MTSAPSFCQMMHRYSPQHSHFPQHSQHNHLLPQRCRTRPRTGLPPVAKVLALATAVAFTVAVFQVDSSLAAMDGFPNHKNTGVPRKWEPKQTYNGYRITRRGKILEDVRIRGDLRIEADDVTVRRVEVVGGRIFTNCHQRVRLARVTVRRRPNQRTHWSDEPAIGPGGYIARRVKIYDLPEGFRVGDKQFGCGRTVIRDSFVLVTAPDDCGGDQWHGDGIQGYGGPRVVVRNTTIDFRLRSGCGGTAPFFYPHSQGNTSVNIDGLLVMGGGYPFRLGMRGPVRNLKIKHNSWVFGPVDVKCSVVTAWDAQIVRIDADYQPKRVVRRQPCRGEGN